MSMIPYIVLSLHVPSVEETSAWYTRVLGWKGHFDTFNANGQCIFGSVMLQATPFVGFNLTRSGEDGRTVEPCQHCSSWIYVENVDEVYRRVLEQAWPVETALETQFWGERLFKLRDINGNLLIFAQTMEAVGLEEIRERHRRLMQDEQEQSS